MADVAARAGVSHQTVSRVLNDSPLVREETRARVLAAIGELGYRRNNAARMLVTNRSGRIGMVAAHLGLHGPSMTALAVQEAAHAAGYDVALVGLSEMSVDSLDTAVERLLDQGVEAMVVAVAHRDAKLLTRSLRLPIPVVLVEGVTHGQAMAAGIDQVAGAALATDHLLDLGHARVAHVTGPDDWIEAAQRRAGWLRAHEERERLPGPELTGDWSAASGYRAGLRIADDPGITAVFAANDLMALGVLHALLELGRAVPGEVSVVGFDDVPAAAHFWPPLTTVSQDFGELGRRAVDLALRALAGEDAPSAELIAPTLIVRDSSAPPVSGAGC
jgi:DNA-binding LacI/PurR family transcriptional regulator